ncbi:DHA2 family efflux MFS transporter permease subunit [Actinomadura sp. 1N219]|uniref:DHA2 family efflux MFS transporter permease subunit n=1 Tax=Actinomadura sp. 1N219 TaxID=3375152 RepID=UPI00378A91CB
MAHVRPAAGRRRPSFAAAVVITGLPMFMATLDSLVVTFGLPMIRRDMGASLETLQWVVNAYTLAFASLLLTASALGDRLGRRRMFAGGIALFTLASVLAALAPTTEILIAARTLQGTAAAAIVPLSLTLLAACVPDGRRTVAIGIWGGMSGLGVALGPVLGGVIVDGLAWQWIFWINVPAGIVAIPLVLTVLRESRGPDRTLDPLGLVLAGIGVLTIVWAIVRADSRSWTSTATITPLIAGAALLVAFLAWQRRASAPLLPLRLFRSRGFGVANAVTLTFSFGTFGSVFLLAQFFQVVQHYSALEAGVRTLPWTMVPMVVAPIAGIVTGKIGGRVLVAAGLTLQAVALAWLGAVIETDVPYSALVLPFVFAGTGMGLTLTPLSTFVLASVDDQDHGKASGTNSTLRQLGVALGIAVLTSVFAANGGYASGDAFTSGLVPAVILGSVVVLAGALMSLRLPSRDRKAATSRRR